MGWVIASASMSLEDAALSDPTMCIHRGSRER
jgi:hypothetical protein